jgi:cytochrome b subunit of formate dehydrogenase
VILAGGPFCVLGLTEGQKVGIVLEALLSFVIFLIIVCVVAGIILWAVQRFFPDIYTPARYIVGAIALIAILYAALGLVRSVHLP